MFHERLTNDILWKTLYYCTVFARKGKSARKFIVRFKLRMSIKTLLIMKGEKQINASSKRDQKWPKSLQIQIACKYVGGCLYRFMSLRHSIRSQESEKPLKSFLVTSGQKWQVIGIKILLYMKHEYWTNYQNLIGQWLP